MKVWALIGEEGEGEAPGTDPAHVRWTPFRTLPEFLRAVRP